ncbi:MAG: 1-acyl-sn-glycerol-3-phosphate acyltransferase [Gemmatimonadota bacterium]|nr:1-acyl-sn-glycerol-3-phosphate acyltransferase [Gemmatimonadota bacterium]
MTRLPFRTRAAHTFQREVGRLAAVFWVIPIAFILRVLMGYRIKDVAQVRARYRALLKESDHPLLICPNHLTMMDSAVVAWALGGSWWYLFHYSRMPWNLPEYNNYSSQLPTRLGAWLIKGIPVIRGGRREDVSRVIKRVQHLLSRGETALIFPEAGRSRSGRVEADAVAHAVGRILTSVPGCQPLCVYLRGDRQQTWSTVPARGDSFYIDFEVGELHSDHSGMRRSRDFSRQIVDRLVGMEEEYFAGR